MPAKGKRGNRSANSRSPVSDGSTKPEERKLNREEMESSASAVNQNSSDINEPSMEKSEKNSLRVKRERGSEEDQSGSDSDEQNGEESGGGSTTAAKKKLKTSSKNETDDESSDSSSSERERALTPAPRRRSPRISNTVSAGTAGPSRSASLRTSPRLAASSTSAAADSRPESSPADPNSHFNSTPQFARNFDACLKRRFNALLEDIKDQVGRSGRAANLKWADKFLQEMSVEDDNLEQHKPEIVIQWMNEDPDAFSPEVILMLMDYFGNTA